MVPFFCKNNNTYFHPVTYRGDIIAFVSERRRLVFFKTVLSNGYILILLSIEYILASLIEMCQG